MARVVATPDLVSEASLAIVAKGIGAVHAKVHPYLKRVFWVAVWDHIGHRDSEVHVNLPAESGHWLGPPTFDVIYISSGDWDSIASSLSHTGVFRSGVGIIPEKQYDAFRSDSDFFGAWLFEGDYRTLITTLAQYEFRQELIHGLNRHDAYGSMLIAFLMAGLDIIGNPTSPNQLAAEILQQATVVYAVPSEYTNAQLLANGIAELFLQLDPSDWPRVSGPAFVDKKGFSAFASDSRAKHQRHELLIDRDYVVRLLWNAK